MTNFRWTICFMLFMATTINYMDRQVLSLTWKDFIAPEFHWTDTDYGFIAGVFAIVYAAGMLFAGRVIDWMGTRKGYLWTIGIWSLGACLHALCGIATEWWVGVDNVEALKQAEAGSALALSIATISVYFFIAARCILAIGEAGNFPVAAKVAAEYFPKKDRAFPTSIYNSGAAIGALVAPVSIPTLASYFRDLGVGNKMSFLQCIRYKQAWAFAVGKFLTDGIWWFFLFWTPAYLSDVYHLPSNAPMAQLLIFVLYAITMLSIIGGWLPTYFVEKKGMNPYKGRMRAMLIFAFFPILTLLAQPLGAYSYWYPIIIIGIAGAAHQAWSSNIYCTVSDMFPQNAIATIIGFGGMAGGIGSSLINMGSGVLFDYAANTQLAFMGFTGKPAGYFIIFCICSVAYLIGWIIMKALVPEYKPIKPES